MNEERDLLAAEYVLGTLDAGERAVATRLRESDPAFERAVTEWAQRLAPLADRAPAAAPSSETWAAIAAKIGPAAASVVSDNVVVLRRAVSRWRVATIATSALAAALALFVIDRDILRRGPAKQPGAYFAAINRGGDMPALIVRVDLASQSVMVRSVEAETPAGKSLELWYVASGQAPKSMGVVGKPREQMPMPSDMDMKDALFAVSVEPMGGSPTGAPTGPVVYKGKLVPE